MKARFRLIHRGERGRTFYCVDTDTGRRTSLKTKDPDAAREIVHAKNQALRQPAINIQLARAYLAGSDSGVNTRTWQHALDAIIEMKHGPTQTRWITAAKDRHFDLIRHRFIIETNAESFLAILRDGTVSTNVYLRKLHNYCLDMGWLPWPIIPKRQWPTIRFGERRAILKEEHDAIIAREPNPERKAFYQLAWHLGASQSDLAFLESDNIDWETGVISFARKKTGSIAVMRFDDETANLLRRLPTSGPLFPYLRGVRAGDRATEFKQRCVGLGIHGVTLHSYRYAWAERAKRAGYPERFAQEALGHNSKAVHRAYARKAIVELPPLSEYERGRAMFRAGAGLPGAPSPAVRQPP
jgi:integrase